jgi:hypothetical protein
MNFDRLVQRILQESNGSINVSDIPLLDGQEEIYRIALFYRDGVATVLPPRRLQHFLFRDSKPHYRGTNASQALDVIKQLLQKAETKPEKAEQFCNHIKSVMHVVGEWCVEGSTIQKDYYTIDVTILVDQDHYRYSGVTDAVADNLDKSVDISNW